MPQAETFENASAYWIETVTERYVFDHFVDDQTPENFDFAVRPGSKEFSDWMADTIQRYAATGYRLKHQMTVPAAYVRERHHYDIGQGHDFGYAEAHIAEYRGPYGYGYGFGYGYGHAAAAHVPQEAILVFERTEIVSTKEFQRRRELIERYRAAVTALGEGDASIDNLRRERSQSEKRIREIDSGATDAPLKEHPAPPEKPDVYRRGKMFSVVFVVDGERDVEHKKNEDAEARAERRYQELLDAYHAECARVDEENRRIQERRTADPDSEKNRINERIQEIDQEIERHREKQAEKAEERDTLAQKIYQFQTSLPV